MQALALELLLPLSARGGRGKGLGAVESFPARFLLAEVIKV